MRVMKSDLRKERKAEDVIEAFFDGATGPGELKSIDRRIARAYLATRLRRRYVTGDLPTYLYALAALDLGKEAGEFARIVGERSLPIGARATALKVLALLDPPMAEKSTSRLDEAEIDRLEKAPLRELLIGVATGQAEPEVLTAMLVAQPELGDELESMRRYMGVPAGLVYDDALLSGRVPDFGATMLEALASEGDVVLLEDLQKTRGDVAGLESALLRARNWTPAYPQATVARLSPAVGHQFAAAIVFPAGERDRLVANAIVDRGSLSEAYVVFEEGPDTDESVFAEVSPAQARALIDGALENFDPVTADRHEGAALEFFHRVVPEEMPPLPRPAENASDEEIAEVISRPYYEPFIMSPALVSELATRPDRVPPPESWYDETVAALVRSDQVREFVVWAAEFMARWHALRGETREASILARAASDASSNLATSPLPRLMLQKMMATVEEGDLDEFDDGDVDEEELEDDISDEAVDRVARAVRPVVEEQIRSGNPPIARATLQRLISEGLSKQEATERIALAMALEMADIVAAKSEFSAERWEKRLRGLTAQ